MNPSSGGGNNFMSDNFLLMMFAFGILFIWIGWIIIETFILHIKRESKLVITNIILLILLVVIPFGISYLKHKYY